MSRPCCDPCCFDGPNCIRLTVITSPCPCLPVGTHLYLYRITDGISADCVAWSTNLASYLCDGVPVEAELDGCRTGCMGCDWTMPGHSKVWIQGGTLRDDWTCEPFFQHWSGVTYGASGPCAGVPFDIEFDSLCGS